MKECLRCNGTWEERVPNPRYCPLCKSPYWDRERVNGSVGQANERADDAAKVQRVPVQKPSNPLGVQSRPAKRKERGDRPEQPAAGVSGSCPECFVPKGLRHQKWCSKKG